MRREIKWKKYIVVILLVVVQCHFFRMNMNSCMERLATTYQLTVGDYIADFYKGTFPYAGFQSQEPFNIPPIWSLFLFYFFAVFSHLYSQMFRQSEYQYVLRKRTRKQWWNCQNLMILAETIRYLATAYLTFIVYGLCTGAKFTGINAKMQLEWNGLDLSGMSNMEFVRDTLVISVFVMLALGYIQYVVSIIGNAMIGMVVSVVILVSSVFCMNPLLPGNYLMLIRGNARMDGGVHTSIGIVLSILLILAAYFAGKRIIQKKDLF